MVTLAELKEHVRVTGDQDDAILASKLAVASEWVAKYTGGDASAADLPSPVSEAVRQLAAHLYENREATLVGVTAEHLPLGVLDLLANYRAWAF